jgi:hypothetical protein
MAGNLVLMVFWGNLMKKYLTSYDLTYPNLTLLEKLSKSWLG